ncbi:MAG: LptF/LptG family permease [Melioribacteraceae bacterium]|nr:LptF/LptG family permease [Melioribacteraceae bacterium]MCF8266305.1 LptF/LptG family permease [Melioribacteraceae bacterium]MCF8432434.1 LptF/LptG family permease [Melioribacteraceae bacterium]
MLVQMKILDRYLIKQFLQTILFGLLAFLVIFVIIDLMENLDDFIDQNVPTYFILKYYVVFIPEIMRLMIPVAVFLACIFTVGRLSNQNELAAIKAGGISIYRFMMPFLITSVLVSIGAIYFGGYTVPEANKELVYIQRNYMKKDLAVSGSNILFQDSEFRIVSITSYNNRNQQAFNVSIQQFSEADKTVMIARKDALKMSYDSLSSAWILTKVIERKFNGIYETIVESQSDTLRDLNFLPDDILRKQSKPEEMSLTELMNYADDQLASGNDPTRILIAYHSRISFGFASLVVVLFGLPFSANKRKGGLALQFGISLLVTFVYLVFMKISQAFGKNGVLDPLLTAWFANIVFLFFGIINLLRVNK